MKFEYNKLIILIDSLNLNGRVFFTGFIADDELKNYYKNSRGLVMPTFYGPTNIPPIEAVFSNCPVLISGIYGMIEQMEDYATYFDPLDPNSISKAMTSLLNSNKPIDSNALSRLKHKFSLKRFALSLEKILNKVID